MIRLYALIFLLLSSSAYAAPTKSADAAKAPKASSDRYGLPVLDSHELVSKVAIVGLNSSAEALIKALHAAAHAKEPVAIDDQGASVWMFGTPIAGPRVHTSSGEFALRIEFLAADGATHERLNDVVNPAHLVVLALKGDETKDTVAQALKLIRAQMRSGRSEQVGVWFEHDGAADLPAPTIAKGNAQNLLSAIVKIIRSGKTPGQ